MRRLRSATKRFPGRVRTCPRSPRSPHLPSGGHALPQEVPNIVRGVQRGVEGGHARGCSGVRRGVQRE
eukprot:730580-Pyramimonas_sp.AAC.1